MPRTTTLCQPWARVVVTSPVVAASGPDSWYVRIVRVPGELLRKRRAPRDWTETARHVDVSRYVYESKREYASSFVR